jgi:hypothetical protein
MTGLFFIPPLKGEGRPLKRSESGRGGVKAAIKTPTRLARSQVYAGCVNLPAMLAPQDDGADACQISNKSRDRSPLRRRVVAEIDKHLIDIAPAPAFRRIVAFDDRMLGGAEMLGGMLVR